MSIQSAHNINELLLKVAQGDEKAFAQLLKTYSNTIAGYILSITESEELVQEIVQDVFMKIWTNRASLGEVESFKSYLLVVARNHAFNCLKRIARERKREKTWLDTFQARDDHQEIETDPIDYGGMIDAAIELLPGQQKKVYMLGYMNRMKHREIAIEMNIATETVKKHMLLALRFIKNHITQVSSILAVLLTLY